MQNDLGARAPPHELPGKMTPDLAKEIGSIISWTFCCAPGGAPGRFAVAISGWFATLRLCQIGPGSKLRWQTIPRSRQNVPAHPPPLAKRPRSKYTFLHHLDRPASPAPIDTPPPARTHRTLETPRPNRQNEASWTGIRGPRPGPYTFSR